jgi:uncharacterized FlaG/YvyC family protein
MNIEINPMNSNRIFKLMVNHLANVKPTVNHEIDTGLSDQEMTELIKRKLPGAEPENIIRDLKKLAEASDIVNKKVKLSINPDINRMIITIMEKDTNRVISIIPCEELQKLAMHLKEAVGILYDKIA